VIENCTEAHLTQCQAQPTAKLPVHHV